MNVVSATELYIFKWLMVYYVNFSSTEKKLRPLNRLFSKQIASITNEMAFHLLTACSQATEDSPWNYDKSTNSTFFISTWLGIFRNGQGNGE